MKIFIAAIIACMLVPVSSFAYATTWSLGNSNGIAVSLFEHRANQTDRVTDVVLIMRGFYGYGEVKDTGQGYEKPTPITLTSKKGSFKGTISIVKNKVTLKGTITVFGSPFQVNEVVSVKELRGL